MSLVFQLDNISSHVLNSVFIQFLLFKFQFILLLMGMKGATSDFACLWCLCHKKNRLVEA